MRFYCGVNLSILFFFIAPYAASAQVSPDSIPTGVIMVQRPAVKPVYRVQMSIIYQDAKSNRKRLTEISSQQIVFSDSAYNPAAPEPSPGYLANENDSTHIVRAEFPQGAKFNWAYYLARSNYKFAWSDSTRLDSARYIYALDKNGNASCKVLPWNNGDASSKEFENKVSTYFLRLTEWKPARRVRRVTGDGQQIKTKKVACIVILVVYAYDPYAGRLLPIEVDGGK